MSGRAAAAEAALQQQAAEYEARLQQLQTWYGKQAAVVAQMRSGRAPGDGQIGFSNTNRCAWSLSAARVNSSMSCVQPGHAPWQSPYDLPVIHMHATSGTPAGTRTSMPHLTAHPAACCDVRRGLSAVLCCRFWMRQELLFDFLKHWVARESLLVNQPGFLGLQVSRPRHYCVLPAACL